jgi:membrane protein implicated in regulation of membrane protease activity
VQAAEANTAAATAWFAGQWFTTPVTWYLYSAHWIVLAIVTVVVGRLLYHRRHRS